MKTMTGLPVSINSLDTLAGPQHSAIIAGMRDVFFQASGVSQWRDADERDAFCATWFGNYVRAHPPYCFVARNGRRVIGYLVGAPCPPDPQLGFSGQHHVSVFRDLWPVFPAHLHVNVAGDCRSAGLGEQLIEAFVTRCHETGVCGLHIVTGDGARNAKFYRKCGFSYAEGRNALERDLLFMGRRLDP